MHVKSILELAVEAWENVSQDQCVWDVCQVQCGDVRADLGKGRSDAPNLQYI